MLISSVFERRMLLRRSIYWLSIAILESYYPILSKRGVNSLTLRLRSSFSLRIVLYFPSNIDNSSFFALAIEPVYYKSRWRPWIAKSCSCIFLKSWSFSTVICFILNSYYWLALLMVWYPSFTDFFKFSFYLAANASLSSKALIAFFNCYAS